MPDAQLTSPQPRPDETARSVLAVLAGVPLDQAAARIRMHPAELADAITTYQAAGSAALHAQANSHTWYQTNVQFTDWDTAEHSAATSLAPRLHHLQATEVITAWWFIRKAPCWRLRVHPGPAAPTDMKTIIGTVLTDLQAQHLIKRSWETIYEPETAAFGGPVAMKIAHALFHADSRNILDHALRPTTGQVPIGRRELSILLCTALLRGAQQDWHEQGDIWHRVAQLRPLHTGTPPERLAEMNSGLQLLMTTDTRPDGPLFGPHKPLAFAAPWITAFTETGRALGAAATSGTLERGVRDTLAHHIIFHWNRLGLGTQTQSILTKAARDTILGPQLSPNATDGS